MITRPNLLQLLFVIRLWMFMRTYTFANTAERSEYPFTFSHDTCTASLSQTHIHPQSAIITNNFYNRMKIIGSRPTPKVASSEQLKLWLLLYPIEFKYLNAWPRFMYNKVWRTKQSYCQYMHKSSVNTSILQNFVLTPNDTVWIILVSQYWFSISRATHSYRTCITWILILLSSFPWRQMNPILRHVRSCAWYKPFLFRF